MLRDYLPPKDEIGGGSSFEEMEASRRQEEYCDRVAALPESLKPLVNSQHMILRGLGALGAAAFDVVIREKPTKLN
jgi:hypothetical protein